jgi:glycerol-3-phosphate O-acyltransferase
MDKKSKSDLYRNNLKNREFDKEAPQNFCSEGVTIAARQGTSENKNSEEKPTPSKTNSSSCFGIWLDELRSQSTEKAWQIGIGFIECLQAAVISSGRPFESHMGTVRLFFQLLREQLDKPYQFEPYHQKIRHPIDYYQFSLDFIRPLIEEKGSGVIGLEFLDKIERQLEAKENVVFFANHQTETDPQAIAILLQKTHPKLAEELIYVAGERVVTDPLAIPFSMGTNLLCIYSKRYIDYPLEQKAQKMLHNKNTMELMSRLLQEGGKAIYVAPSGGRDRRDSNGHVLPAPFDPNSIEMFYLMAKKAKTPTHFYPLALDTYELLPPPETVQVELGEMRVAKRTPIHLAFGPAFDMEHIPQGDSKEARRKARADAIWQTVYDLYRRI